MLHEGLNENQDLPPNESWTMENGEEVYVDTHERVLELDESEVELLGDVTAYARLQMGRQIDDTAYVIKPEVGGVPFVLADRQGNRAPVHSSRGHESEVRSTTIGRDWYGDRFHWSAGVSGSQVRVHGYYRDDFPFLVIENLRPTNPTSITIGQTTNPADRAFELSQLGVRESLRALDEEVRQGGMQIGVGHDRFQVVDYTGEFGRSGRMLSAEFAKCFAKRQIPIPDTQERGRQRALELVEGYKEMLEIQGVGDILQRAAAVAVSGAADNEYGKGSGVVDFKKSANGVAGLVVEVNHGTKPTTAELAGQLVYLNRLVESANGRDDGSKTTLEIWSRLGFPTTSDLIALYNFYRNDDGDSKQR